MPTSLNRGRQTCAGSLGSSNERKEDPGRTSGALCFTRIPQKATAQQTSAGKGIQQEANPLRKSWTAGRGKFWTQRVTYGWKTTTDDINHSSRTPSATATVTRCGRVAVHGPEDIKSTRGAQLRAPDPRSCPDCGRRMIGGFGDLSTF